MSSTKGIRKFHRLVSIFFMATVVFTSVALTMDNSAVWVSYVPLPPLFVLMGTGVYMWFLPAIAQRRARRAAIA
jgi:membrane protein CcdC involved in cytochrome C biogenesis